jgi:ribosome maturation factor RimP
LNQENVQETDVLRADLEPVLSGAGIRLLELSVSRHHGSAQVKAVVYSPSGTGTDECVKAHRLMLPRIALTLGVQEPHMEISSPGIDRVLKSSREWEIFSGKFVRVLPIGESEWRAGRIVKVEAGRATLAADTGSYEIDLSTIAKARLDSSREGV